jgi:mono/diheme cytochrome c family protein
LFDEIPGMALWSANLSVLAKTNSDADFDRAIRQGLRKDATSLLLMPSYAYAAMPDDELAAIIAYIRSRPERGQQRPAPRWGLLVHAILAFDLAKTARGELAERKNAFDAGPQHAAGRLLAQISCGECHATDLTGGPAAGPMPAPPDLSIVASYDKGDFVKFMRTGKAAGDRELPMMSGTARARFSHFTDAEVSALYDYLAARGNALAEVKQ